MSIEVLAFIATVVFGFAGVAAAWFGYKSLRASQEQLRLAQEQASRVPLLAVTSAILLPLARDAELEKEVADSRELLEEIEEGRAEKQRAEEKRLAREREREKQEREEREQLEGRGRGFNISALKEVEEEPGTSGQFRLPWSYMERRPMFKLPEVPTIRIPPLSHANSEPYVGPLPDAFLELEVRNVGRAAAYEVMGWLTLDGSVLEPVDWFADRSVSAVANDDGTWKVELRLEEEGGRLLPSEHDWIVFRVPVVQRQTEGSSSLRYEFTSPQGGETEGRLELEMNRTE